MNYNKLHVGIIVQLNNQKYPYDIVLNYDKDKVLLYECAFNKSQFYTKFDLKNDFILITDIFREIDEV